MKKRMRTALLGLVCGLAGCLAGQSLFGPWTLFAQDRNDNGHDSEARPISRFVNVGGSWFPLRTANEPAITDRTKRVGMEVFRDQLAGNSVYVVSETGSVAAVPAHPNYELRVMRRGKVFECFRFSPEKGEAWRELNDKWEKIPESGAVPAGDYDIVLTPMADETFAAHRIDRRSGKSWYYTHKWNEIVEPK